MTPTDFIAAEEDDITGELCKHMKFLTEEQALEPWMAHYSVHDQDPVNDVTDTETGDIRRGKRRPKLDIRLVSKLRVPNIRFCIEAKRLHRSRSLKDYMDDEGLGAFIAEYYAKDDGAAGMLGYVQSECIGDWVAKMRERLSAETSVTDPWVLSQFAGGPVHTYVTIHHRKTHQRRLQIYHTVLSFVPDPEE